MKRLEIDFWRIELQITNNISNLLSAYLRERAAYEGQKVSLLEQSGNFGAWIISKDNKQIIYNDKEQWFVMRLKKSEVNGIDEMVMKLNEITPEKIDQLYSWIIGF